MNNTLKIIGSEIRQRRETLNYTQADLAELTSISERTIRSIEQGSGTNLKHIVKILDILGLMISVTVKQISDETRKGI